MLIFRWLFRTFFNLADCEKWLIKDKTIVNLSYSLLLLVNTKLFKQEKLGNKAMSAVGWVILQWIEIDNN